MSGLMDYLVKSKPDKPKPPEERIMYDPAGLTLRQRQSMFVRMVADLLDFAHARGSIHLRRWEDKCLM